MAEVTPQATFAFAPMMMVGMPGTVAPPTWYPAPLRETWQKRQGRPIGRCGSLQSRGWPLCVRPGPTTQLLLPPIPPPKKPSPATITGSPSGVIGKRGKRSGRVANAPRQTVLGSPGLGFVPEQIKLRRKASCFLHQGHDGVDTSGIPLEDRACLGRNDPVRRVRHANKAQGAGQGVQLNDGSRLEASAGSHAKRPVPQELRELASSQPSIKIHLPQPVLGHGVTKAEKEVGGGPGVDGGDPEAVARDRDGPVETDDRLSPAPLQGQAGWRGGEEGRGGAGGKEGQGAKGPIDWRGRH